MGKLDISISSLDKINSQYPSNESQTFQKSSFANKLFNRKKKRKMRYLNLFFDKCFKTFLIKISFDGGFSELFSWNFFIVIFLIFNISKFFFKMRKCFIIEFSDFFIDEFRQVFYNFSHSKILKSQPIFHDPPTNHPQKHIQYFPQNFLFVLKIKTWFFTHCKFNKKLCFFVIFFNTIILDKKLTIRQKNEQKKLIYIFWGNFDTVWIGNVDFWI